MGNYIAPDLHEIKMYFCSISPKTWMNSWPLLPIAWFAKCCGGERGPLRTPRSGLTWYNILFCGIYQYCLVRFSMSIIAVVTQPLGRYCELSNSPRFAHIWVLIIDAVSSSIAMCCLESFNRQLKEGTKPHAASFKFYCVKMVFSLSLYQNLIMSLLTSSWLPTKIRNNMALSATLNAFDIKIGIPYLMLSFELAIIAILHLFAFPSKDYSNPKPSVFGYPFSTVPDLDSHGPRQGGFLGVKDIADSANPWDVVKPLRRSLRWLLVGRRLRENDLSYKANSYDENDMSLELASYGMHGYRRRDDLTIVDEFCCSRFGLP
ncbi:hypothetical protein BDZ45DRAFT_221568 [Acephala macrosclerotiorum]|nr:hypothetical protein BDZ45DRAFT_221568 [Acephala macrosclerotiorum]